MKALYGARALGDTQLQDVLLGASTRQRRSRRAPAPAHAPAGNLVVMHVSVKDYGRALELLEEQMSCAATDEKRKQVQIITDKVKKKLRRRTERKKLRKARNRADVDEF